jgi:hypothetical protein
MSFTQEVPHLSGSMVHVYIGLNLWEIPTEKAGKITCILNILFHLTPRLIIIITLAPTHPVVKEKKTITKVSFNVGGVNRRSQFMGDSHRKSRKDNLYIKYFVSFDSKTDNKSFAQTRKIVMKGQIEF